MNRFLLLRVLAGVVGLSLLAPSVAQAQFRAVTEALWQFEPGGGFLVDSSGNGHNLQNGAGAAAAVSSPDVMNPALDGSGSAFFDGAAVMRTAATLDLSAADIVGLRVSWAQRNQTPVGDGVGVVVEQSANYTTVPGAFSIAVNSNLPGTGDAATQGYVALTGSGAGQTSELYQQSTAGDPGTWRRYEATILRNTAVGANIITVIDLSTGENVGTTNNNAPTLPVAFANDILYIGAQGDGAAMGFTGNIDSLLIESLHPVSPVSSVNAVNTVNTVNTVTGVTAVAGVTAIGASSANGVLIDAKGVLRLPDAAEMQHLKERIAAARAKPNTLIAKPSKLRKVSLNRLEAAIRAKLLARQQITDEMQFLAGLTRIKNVFYYPETNDIVLAGPAEGWAPDATGRVSGIVTGRPPLQIQDLLVALRAFGPHERKFPTILCSIDPTPEGLTRMQEFLQSVGSHITPNDTQMIVDGLRTSLGMQNVRVGGVPANTRFAQVLLECDYRMKLIGIGLERPPIKLASYVDRASPNKSRRALERWFFIPDYKCARVAADGMGLELVGDGVTLVSENQLVAADGSRAATGRSDRASEAFTRGFTQKYPELAMHVPVFAEMRNLIDMAVAAAFIKEQDFYAKAGWEATLLNDETVLPVQTANTPLQVETVCTAVWKGNRLMTPVGGGVNIRAHQALQTGNRLEDEDGEVARLRESIDIKDLPLHRWWWD